MSDESIGFVGFVEFVELKTQSRSSRQPKPVDWLIGKERKNIGLRIGKTNGQTEKRQNKKASQVVDWFDSFNWLSKEGRTEN